MREHSSANPFAALRPALELIIKEAKVLPAAGQAGYPLQQQGRC